MYGTIGDIMANVTTDLKPLQVPGEVLPPQNGSKYEEYKSDGVYEYDLLPSGKPNRTHVKITYNTGDVYEGNFRNDKYNGQGKYTWEDGSVFEGTFKDGQLLNGRYTDASGSVYDCKFSYKRNGERKNSVIRLIRLAQPKVTAGHEEKKPAKKKTEPKDGLLSKDKAVITAIKKSKRGPEFKNLYSGAAGNTEKSERSLIAILNFFSNSDAEQMARIFKSSAIYDKTKGDEHVTDMISGVIKRGKDFTSTMKATTNTKQKDNSAKKGAAK